MDKLRLVKPAPKSSSSPATNSDPSKTLSDIMLDSLKKSPSLAAKQAHLVEQLKSGTNPELQDVLMNLLTGSEPKAQPSAPEPTTAAETLEQAKALGTLEESLVKQTRKGQLPKSSKGGPAK